MPLQGIRDLWHDLDLKAHALEESAVKDRYKHWCEWATEEAAKGSSAAFRFIRGDDAWLEFQ
eukprot:1319821-Pyramimonas_sp.AAC.1